MAMAMASGLRPGGRMRAVGSPWEVAAACLGPWGEGALRPPSHDERRSWGGAAAMGRGGGRPGRSQDLAARGLAANVICRLSDKKNIPSRRGSHPSGACSTSSPPVVLRPRAPRVSRVSVAVGGRRWRRAARGSPPTRLGLGFGFRSLGLRGSGCYLLCRRP
jgi:hypothetical protein